ncbi:MAG: ABC transporter ATP-binding protein [bacterium]|nr:ABC transporter ATP-binding protein [bacterium]
MTDRREETAAGSPLIQTAGLYKNYGSIRALEEINLEVPPGVTGLIGANGAGKTTLIRLLLGLIQPTYGEVSVFGTPVADDPAGLRARMGYMPEGKCLPPDQTAADFVAYAAELAGIPASESRRRASETLFLVGLHEERFRYLGDFSTGMQQRVKLAQGIVHDPDLVLLDEPASGLDPEGRDQMLELIGRFRRFGMNVLFSSHILDDIERTCDWVVMLDAGRLIHSAPLDPPSKGDRVSVEVFGDPRSLVAALAGQGADVTVVGGVVTVGSRSEDPFMILRDALDRSGSSVRRMGTSLSRLEDVLVAAAREANG